MPRRLHGSIIQRSALNAWVTDLCAVGLAPHMKHLATIQTERLLAETYEIAWIVALTRDASDLLNQVTTRLSGLQFIWPFELLMDGLPQGTSTLGYLSK